jgi:mycothiol synthase
VIELRACESDADLEQWLAVRRAVLPHERTASLEEFRASIKVGDLQLLAQLDGELAGSGLCNSSDIEAHAFLAPRVLPDRRGHGVGSALLRRLAEHAVERGFRRAGVHVAGDDEASIAFARKYGFEEQRRDVQQVLIVDAGVPTPRDLDGVEFRSVADDPGLVGAAFPLAQQGFADMPIDNVVILLDDWLRDEASLPAGSFAALADGEIVGYAGLMRWADEPTKAEHGLTVVRRDWRGRGLATALKQRQIAWAAANGIRELVTYTQTGNENMQRVNERLGYVIRSFSINFARDLPIQ